MCLLLEYVLLAEALIEHVFPSSIDNSYQITAVLEIKTMQPVRECPAHFGKMSRIRLVIVESTHCTAAVVVLMFPV